MFAGRRSSPLCLYNSQIWFVDALEYEIYGYIYMDIIHLILGTCRVPKNVQILYLTSLSSNGYTPTLSPGSGRLFSAVFHRTKTHGKDIWKRYMEHFPYRTHHRTHPVPEHHTERIASSPPIPGGRRRSWEVGAGTAQKDWGVMDGLQMSLSSRSWITFQRSSMMMLDLCECSSELSVSDLLHVLELFVTFWVTPSAIGSLGTGKRVHRTPNRSVKTKQNMPCLAW